jgi:maleylacetate reductase
MALSMKPFTYQAHPSRVVFGAGVLRELPAELDRLGASRVLVLSTPGHAGAAARVAELIGARGRHVCASGDARAGGDRARGVRRGAARAG